MRAAPNPEAAVVYHKGKKVVTSPVVRRVSGKSADETYTRILDRADDFFRSIAESQPQNLQCGRGCSLCCYGLFEIGSGEFVTVHVAIDNPGVRRAEQAVFLPPDFQSSVVDDFRKDSDRRQRRGRAGPPPASLHLTCPRFMVQAL